MKNLTQKAINYSSLLRYQPEHAIRTFDEEGTSPFIKIYENAKKLRTKKILFRLDPDFFDTVRKALEVRGAVVNKIFDEKGVFRFIEVNTNYG